MNGRGNLWDHDAGPAKSSGWPELFAATPNYRGLGRAVLGREAFRWHFGPMFFRGRLDGSARVVVVGQEGAQDESLAHRSFTGGTGARMQHFLGHLGIDRSYVFLNTFVYPIFGQYTDSLRPMAQDRRSPIVAHRHRIFDKVVEGGEVRLVIAVGRAAKETVATWITTRGGTADAERLHQADPPPALAGVRFLGVLHPGGASAGGTGAIKADFGRAAAQVATWLTADPGWLPADPGVPRHLDEPFVYRSAPVPSRSAPVPGWAGGRRRRTGPTTSGASSSSPPAASTKAPAPRSTTRTPAAARRTATRTSRAIWPSSRPGPSPGCSTPDRPRATPASSPGPSPGWPGPTSPPSASPRIRRSGRAPSTEAGSRRSAWWSWPTRPARTTSSPAGRSPARPASGCRPSWPRPG